MPCAGRRARDQLIHDGAKFGRVERLADHAGGRQEHIRRFAAGGSGGDVRRELGRRAPGLAGKGVGVARIHHECARRPALKMRATPIDRSGRAFRPREHAGHGRALLEQRQQHVGAAAIADTGGGGRQFDSRHQRHVRKAGGRERGNGCCHGVVSLSWPERTAQAIPNPVDVTVVSCRWHPQTSALEYGSRSRRNRSNE